MHSLTDADFDRIADDLAHRYSDVIDRDSVAGIVAAVRAELEPSNRHPEFLTALVAKQARDRVVEAIRDAGHAVHAVPEILFVCQHNTGRSQIAAAFAEHLGGGHVHVRAAGAQSGGERSDVIEQVMTERELPFSHEFEHGTAGDLLHRADIVVQMGASVPELPGVRVISWDVPDPKDLPIEKVRLVRDQIENNVRVLLHDLGVPSARQGDHADAALSSGSVGSGHPWPEAHRGSRRA